MDNNEKEVKKGLNEELGAKIANGEAGNDLTVTFVKVPEPLELHEQTPIEFSGVIDSPARWLEKRQTQIEGLECHVIVDKEEMTVEMVTEERNHFKNVITGSLKVHPKFEEFGINRKVERTPNDLADYIKMNRAFFESVPDAMALVVELKGFRAKVTKDLERKNDNQGNVTDLTAQVVESNLPKAFNLVIPLFRGEAKQKIEVEVYVNPNTFACSLVSPQAAEEMERTRDNAIKDCCDRILAVDSTIVIFDK